MKRVLIPGSYDPMTAGHLDVILRAAALFDEVYVTVFQNSEKHTFFSGEQRLEMLRLACAPFCGQSGLGKIICGISDGFLAQYAADNKIDAVIKGARNATDFDYEYWLSLILRSFDGKIETLVMPAKAEFQHISSTVVRELIKYNKPLTGYVPAEVAAYIGAGCEDAGR